MLFHYVFNNLKINLPSRLSWLELLLQNSTIIQQEIIKLHANTAEYLGYISSPISAVLFG